jgi:hypothetical protein
MRYLARMPGGPLVVLTVRIRVKVVALSRVDKSGHLEKGNCRRSPTYGPHQLNQ